MKYLVVVTFDIKDGDEEDYQTIYKGLAKLGLEPELKSDSGNICKLPTTTTAGWIEAESFVTVRDQIAEKAKAVFTSNGLKGEIFVSAGNSWGWRTA